jgi:MOSC domain-containing protein YiiM
MMIKAWLHKRFQWTLGLISGMGRSSETGVLVAIYLADAAGEAMRECDQALARADRGLTGDRYAEGRGFWRLTDGCQVTLIQAEDLEQAARRHHLDLSQGQHRRNLVVAGLTGQDLRGQCLRVGDALLDWHRVRPPCGYLDRVSGPGTAKALGRKAGHCLRVRKTGLIRVGDRVTPVPRDQCASGATPRTRSRHANAPAPT